MAMFAITRNYICKLLQVQERCTRFSRLYRVPSRTVMGSLCGSRNAVLISAEHRCSGATASGRVRWQAAGMQPLGGKAVQ